MSFLQIEGKSSKIIMTHFIAMLIILQCSGVELSISPKYVCITMSIFHLSIYPAVLLPGFLKKLFIGNYLPLFISMSKGTRQGNVGCKKIVSLFPHVLEYFVPPTTKNMNIYCSMLRL